MYQTRIQIQACLAPNFRLLLLYLTVVGVVFLVLPTICLVTFEMITSPHSLATNINSYPSLSESKEFMNVAKPSTQHYLAPNKYLLNLNYAEHLNWLTPRRKEKRTLGRKCLIYHLRGRRKKVWNVIQWLCRRGYRFRQSSVQGRIYRVEELGFLGELTQTLCWFAKDFC